MKGVNESLHLLKTSEVVGDKVLDGEFTKHDFVHQFRYILARLPSTKSSSFPASSSDELEWACCEFLTGSSNSDNHGLSETSVSTLKSVTHDRDETSAIVGEVNTPLFFAD